MDTQYLINTMILIVFVILIVIVLGGGNGIVDGILNG